MGTVGWDICRICRGMAQNRRMFLTFGAGVPTAASCKQPLGKSESGAHMRAYGERSPFEGPVRVVRELTASSGTGSSRTPHAELYGTITPSALHFERHHSGVPSIDPAAHRLLIHGLVEKPLVFTMEEIKRFPSFSRTHFLECGENTIGERSGSTQPDVQRRHRLLIR